MYCKQTSTAALAAVEVSAPECVVYERSYRTIFNTNDGVQLKGCDTDFPKMLKFCIRFNKILLQGELTEKEI